MTITPPPEPADQPAPFEPPSAPPDGPPFALPDDPRFAPPSTGGPEQDAALHLDAAVHTDAPPPTGEPVSVQPPPPEGRVRPWWGMGDVLLSIPVIIVAAVVGTLVGLPFTDLDALVDPDSTATPMALLVTSLYGQQLGQAAWPLLVARWKGFGAAVDWRFRFHPWDLAIGLGTAVIAVGLSAVVGTVMAELVGLADDAEAANTQFLEDAEGTVWLWFLLIGVAIGAPVAEELFFRGLVLRAIEKRAGRVVAVIGSTLIFTLPHFTGAGLAGTLVLFSSIASIGLVLAVVAVVVDRLGPGIIAHALFNVVGAAGALGAFDNLAT